MCSAWSYYRHTLESMFFHERLRWEWLTLCFISGYSPSLRVLIKLLKNWARKDTFLQLKFVDAVNFAQILQVFFSFPSFFLYGLPFNRKIGAENSKKKIPLPFLLSHYIWKDIRITYIILNKALVPRWSTDLPLIFFIQYFMHNEVLGCKEVLSNTR